MMDHLTDIAKEQLLLPVQERIEKIMSDRWIGYTKGKIILNSLEELLVHPRISRMPNILIVGESNNGKTNLINRFYKQHLPFSNTGEDGMKYPVISIQAPSIPDEKRFYDAILDKIGAPFRVNDRVEKKLFQVIEMLPRLNVKMLIIDEIHHILAGTMAKQRTFLNVIKYLANELKISIVCVGTKDAFNALHTDPQLANRFEPMILPRWEWNEEYLRLLASFEALLPLKNSSGLTESSIAMKILAKSESTIGEISTLLKRAAILSIENGEERITKKILDQVHYISPSDRKNRIEKIN